MLTRNSRICVTSRTFVKSKELRNLLEKEFYNITYNEEGIHFDEEGLIAFLEQCDGAIVSEDKISKLVIDRLPNLKIISKYGVGLDSIDLEYLKKKAGKASMEIRNQCLFCSGIGFELFNFNVERVICS